ncbi:MAG: malonyl-ACP O-methyltransferase BioC [Kangiellaceae bacterium]
MNKIKIKDVQNSFSKAAKNYESSAFLQKEVASRLLERLDLMNVKPKRVLDAGCGTGYCSRALNKKYKKADVFGIDIANGMIEEAKNKNSLFNKVDYQCADINKLPFDNDYFDLVFSNLAVQWIMDPKLAFLELNRVLKPGGILIFSSMGEETLTELKQSWATIDQRIHVNHFFDMKQVGDQVFSSNFENTVMDRDIITMSYQTMIGLMKDLKAIGANNINTERPKGLMGKTKFKQVEIEYEKFRWEDGQLPATYEVIYGHAWKKMEDFSGGYHTYKVELDNS